MKLQRLVDMLFGHPAPPNDERSRKAVRLDAVAQETVSTLERVDLLIPPRHRRSLKERMRAESLAGGDRVSR